MTAQPTLGNRPSSPARHSLWARTASAAALALFLTVLTGLAPSPSPQPAAPAAAAAESESRPEVMFEVIPSITRAVPADQVTIAVVIDHAPNWHVWPNQPELPPELADVMAIPTTITLAETAALSHIGPVQYPEASDVRVEYGTEPVIIKSYKGRAVAFVPVIIAPDAPPGPLTLQISVRYQACDNSICLMPTTAQLEVPIEIVAAGSPGAGEPNQPALFAGFDASVFARMLAGEVAQSGASGGGNLAEFDFIGFRFSLASNAYLLIFAIAFVAGFLLNLTPCVLPVIPLKVLSLQKQANNPAKLALYGTVYCVGIVATFVVLGLLILGIRVGAEKQDWGQVFSSPIFAMVMAVIVGVMGLGMMGLFTIKLPKAVYMVNPTGDTVQGNFMMGVLTAILSTPCTGPFLGATIAWAVTQPKWVGMTAFIVMGLGMAFPYALLILFPKLIDRMPRSGPGGELLKQVLGLILLAVAAFLASNVTSEKWPWYIVGGLAALAFLWTIVGGWRVMRKTSGKLIVTAIGILGLAGTTLATRSLTSEGPIPWVYYSPEAFAQAQAEGKTVVMKFTAKWCTNCHVIEKTILNVSPAREALNARNVVPMKVDLTLETNEVGWSKLREISGGSGIPLTAIYLPGEPEPVIFRSFYGADSLIEVLDSAAAAR